MIRNITKIVTHSGTFHADEVLAVALLRRLGCGAIVVRTQKVNESDLSDPNVCVIDTGNSYVVELNNYDHHHNADLPAANRLVLEAFVSDEPLKQQLRSTLFDRVSDIDTGKARAELNEINSLVRAMNGLENGFERAVFVVGELLAARIDSCRRYLNDKERWKHLKKDDGVALCIEQEPLVGWKELAASDNVWLLVCPAVRGGYNLISRDSEQLRIPPHENQLFLHKSGFMAVYTGLSQALDHGFELARSMSKNDD